MKPNQPFPHLGPGAVALALTGMFCLARAQPLTLSRIADLNPGSAGSFATNLTVFAGKLYFGAYSLSTGTELWQYDGVNVTLTTNINDTAEDLGGGLLAGNSSSPGWLTEWGAGLFFSAFDPWRGGELWRYDGTNALRVADINPDSNDSIKTNPASSWPNELTVLGGLLFFSADGGGPRSNYELWNYDGLLVRLAANLRPNIGADHSSFPKHLTPFNGAVYFMADNGANGYELWKANGAGAALLEINPGGADSSSFPKYFTVLGHELYFQAFHDSYGFELWKTDGASVSLVADLNLGANSSAPEFLTAFKGALYFRGDDGTNGFELWKYDGVMATLATNINPSGNGFPKNLTVFGDELCFAADDGIHGWELWKYDGVSGSLVADLNPGGDSFPEYLTVLDRNLYFVATHLDTGYELWKYDGSTVTLVADVNPGAGNSFPQSLALFEEALYFSAAEDGVSDWELWRLSPAPLRTRLTAIAREGDDIRITWTTVGGTTNRVQRSDNLSSAFSNLSDPMFIPGTGETVTHYIDAGAASAVSSRFYRVVQP